MQITRSLVFLLLLYLAVPAAAQQSRLDSESSDDSGFLEWKRPEPQSSAQSNGSPPAMPSDPTQVPVDGGLALLTAAGVGYALHKLRPRPEEDET